MYTTIEIARMTGLHTNTIRKRARSRGIGQKVGRDYVFTEEEVEMMKDWPYTVGRPVTKQPQPE